MASEKIRNVVIAGHGGCGKTSLTEGLLFTAKATTRLGKIEDGSTVSDYDQDEIKKKISISSSLAPCEWKGHTLNFMDTPGYADFVGEVVQAMRVADAAIIVVSAASGVEVGAERVWGFCRERSLPRAIFINKLDRESSDFDRTLSEVRQHFSDKCVAVHVPIGKEDSFKGVIDLLTGKAHEYDAYGAAKEITVPDEEAGRIEQLKKDLIERVVETDEALMEKYFAEEEITDEELHHAMNEAVFTGQIYPVICGSATKLIGLSTLMDDIVDDFPGPLAAGKTEDADGKDVAQKEDGPLVAFVFKTMTDPFVGHLSFLRVYSGKLVSDSHVWNADRNKDERIGQVFKMRGKEHLNLKEAVAGEIAVVAKLSDTHTNHTLCEKGKVVKLPEIKYPSPISFAAVEPKAKGDEEKIGTALHKLAESDPTLHVERNVETHQTVISGMGSNHLDIIVERLKEKYGVEVRLSVPKVPYKETIRRTTKTQYKHKKQTGGRGQYAEVYLELSPTERGEGFLFAETIFGGAIPKNFIPAVQKGVEETLEKGVISGSKVVDVKVNVYDGSFHPVDSSEMAFKIASSQAFKKGFTDADPVLLEPIQKVTIYIPDRFMGDIMGDINTRRGKILDTGNEGATTRVEALVPLAEMYSYSVDLTSMTGGRGRYTMEFDHYEEVPGHIAEKVISERKAGEEKE